MECYQPHIMEMIRQIAMPVLWEMDSVKSPTQREHDNVTVRSNVQTSVDEGRGETAADAHPLCMTRPNVYETDTCRFESGGMMRRRTR